MSIIFTYDQEKFIPDLSESKKQSILQEGVLFLSVEDFTQEEKKLKCNGKFKDFSPLVRLGAGHIGKL